MLDREEIMRLFKEYAPRLSKSIKMSASIPNNKIRNAIKSFAHDADSDKVLGGVNAAFFDTFTSGDLFTEDAYYFHFFDCKGAVYYDRTECVEARGKHIRVYPKGGGSSKELTPLGMNIPALVEYLNKMIALHSQASSDGSLKNGDVIRVSRKLYSHYGVYVEGGNVIHYTGAEGPSDFNGIVRETSLDEFLNGAAELKVCLFPHSIDSVDELNHPAEISVSFSEGIISSRNPLADIMRTMEKRARAEGCHLYSWDETVDRARSQLGKGGHNLITNMLMDALSEGAVLFDPKTY